MSFKAKKLLLILELNETLIYINNMRSKVKDFQAEMMKVTYHDKINNNYEMAYRNGKQELLESFFHIQRDKIDVGVWTNLDSQIGEIACQKYFGRYYRDLLFVLPTNRALYSNNNEPQQNIPIPKQLNALYNKFPGYDSTNTLVLSSLPNPLTQHSKNDMIIPKFSPKHPNFLLDVGCIAMTKYVKGILHKIETQNLKDVRIINSGKPLSKLYDRFANRTFDDTLYN